MYAIRSYYASLDADGFTLGADPSVNQPGVTYYWTAFADSTGAVAVGTYTGDGLDDRNSYNFV